MYGCESWTIKKGWALKILCLQTVVLEKTLESPLHNKEIKTVNPKGNQSWISIKRTDAENEATKLWSPDVKSWIIGKDPDAGKDRKQEEKEMTEKEMVGWHHWLNGHELEKALGDGEGQESLECCGLWDRKELDMKAECQRIDAFELWCWRRLLRALGTEGRSKQSILKEINTEYSSEGLMLKLKLQYFGHLIGELTH